MAGYLIVFEGPDGSGTTLHTALLAEHLQAEGLDVLTTCEPTDGPIGQQIRDTLHSGEELSPASLQELFVQDRAWHLEHVIQPALDAGKTVITDRYLHSTLAYGQALGLPLKWLKDLNKDFIQPDVLFLLLPPYEICVERMGRREKHDSLEEESIQHKVYGAYRSLAEADPSIHVIDTSGEKQEVAEEIFNVVSALLINK